ncbi:hypothetical protein Plo01_11900 [Planobispora longispora]|uniref:Uncharacterized protein n=2 Tax=Planobispora longispora TaxID=28887 RepID=A0A8J3W4D7_9ACTN|nr:hypothetical protein Plo01_11900 [Planobispora longispora]
MGRHPRETLMGKFDGMDPELVRELLAEVKQAAEQMRTVEGRVTRLMSGAGLSSQSAHRPVQVAEACDTMVKDVSGRVTLLEKKHDQKGTSGEPRVTDQSADDSPKPEPKDSTPDPKPEPKDSTPDPKPEPKEPPPDPTHDEPPAPQPRDSGDSTPGPGKDSGAAPDGSRGDGVVDTPGKDHSDDVDQSGDPKPQVVVVDGVKVLQIPLDPPTAEEVETLLRNIQDVPPMDMPSVEGASDSADTRPGQVEPGEPLPGVKPDGPVLDTAEPAEGQTIQPPGTGGEATRGEVTEGSGSGGDRGGSTAPWADDGSEVVSVAARPPDPEALKVLVDNVREIEPLDMPDAQATAGDPGTGDSGGSGSGGDRGGSTAPWADDGSEVVSVAARPPDPEALRVLVDNVREIEPLDMPDVRVPDGETWGEGPWAPMDIRPDGPAGDVEPGDPLRPIPPPGGSSSAESV